MFHRILTRGAQRDWGSIGQLRWNKYSSQKDLQTYDVPKKERSDPVAEDVCEMKKNQSQQIENRKMLIEGLKKMHKDSNEDKPGPTKISGYHQSVVPQWRHSVPWPVYRGPEVKMVPDKGYTEVGVVPDDEKPKLSRRDCLRLMYKEERQKSSKEKMLSADIEWKERQQELEKRMLEADKNKYVYQSEMSTEQKEDTD